MAIIGKGFSAAIAALAMAPLAGCTMVPPASAQPVSTEQAAPTYADLVDIAEAADLVIRAEIKRQAQLEGERAPGLAPGFARLYIEAETQALIGGSVPIGEKLKYLVDVPLTDKGRVPKLKKQTVLIFASPVQGKPAQLQLVDPNAQFIWSEPLEARIRPIVAELVAPDAAPVITGVADALSISGNLVGESETQVFLETVSGDPASFTVLRRPGQPIRWGMSFSEIVDQAAQPVERETLAWYRLACSLPRTLPASANLSRDPAARQRAEEDYAYVIGQIGPCQRVRERA